MSSEEGEVLSVRNSFLLHVVCSCLPPVGNSLVRTSLSKLVSGYLAILSFHNQKGDSKDNPWPIY